MTTPRYRTDDSQPQGIDLDNAPEGLPAGYWNDVARREHARAERLAAEVERQEAGEAYRSRVLAKARERLVDAGLCPVCGAATELLGQGQWCAEHGPYTAQGEQARDAAREDADLARRELLDFREGISCALTGDTWDSDLVLGADRDLVDNVRELADRLRRQA